MHFELLPKRIEPIVDARQEGIHTLKILILVKIKEFLEIVPHKRGVSAYESIFATGNEVFPSPSIEISIDPILFLFETLFSLLQVVGHAILSKKCLGFSLVIVDCGEKEVGLEVILVNIKACFVGVRIVEAKGNKGLNYLLDQGLVYCIAVALQFD
jgi:hypothetical protein